MPLKKTIIFLLIFVIGFSGCTSEKSESINIKVESLREHYQTLMDEARLWQRDAYLQSATFDFEERGMSIRAHFQSPSNDDESLQIVLDAKDNQLSKDIFAHEIPIRFHIPIEEVDWKLDSVDAINTFLSFNDIQERWEQFSQRCNSLEIRHFYVNEQWILAWVLTLSDCKSHSEYFYIDPISGNRLDLVY